MNYTIKHIRKEKMNVNVILTCTNANILNYHSIVCAFGSKEWITELKRFDSTVNYKIWDSYKIIDVTRDSFTIELFSYEFSFFTKEEDIKKFIVEYLELPT